MTTDPAEQAILRLLNANSGKTISPTDAARALAGNSAGDAWRASLSPIKLAAHRLAKAGVIEFLRKGHPVPAAAARGVIRLRLITPQETASE
jgi:hypothetical protein